jgi:hypothetical protein
VPVTPWPNGATSSGLLTVDSYGIVKWSSSGGAIGVPAGPIAQTNPYQIQVQASNSVGSTILTISLAVTPSYSGSVILRNGLSGIILSFPILAPVTATILPFNSISTAQANVLHIGEVAVSIQVIVNGVAYYTRGTTLAGSYISFAAFNLPPYSEGFVYFK